MSDKFPLRLGNCGVMSNWGGGARPLRAEVRRDVIQPDMELQHPVRNIYRYWFQ